MKTLRLLLHRIPFIVCWPGNAVPRHFMACHLKDRLIHAISFALVMLICPAHAQFEMESDAMILGYDRPASNWEKEALPLGNGRLGCMVFGGVEQEHIQFNEDSLWLGSELDTGSYQAFGDIDIAFDHAEASAYRRALDIGRAVHSITYSSGGTNYKREYFSSAPAQVMVFRFTADRKSAYTGKITFEDAHQALVKTEQNRITAVGNTDGTWDKRVKGPNLVLNYEAQIWVLNEGGSLKAVEGGIEFTKCDGLTILVGAGTDYINEREKGWKQEHPHQRISEHLDQASKRSFDDLLRDHVEDYRGLFDRLTIDLGQTSEISLSRPVSLRMEQYRKGGADPD